MPKIEASVVIGRSCAEVFTFVMTPVNAPRYDPAVLRYESLDGRPLHLGSRVRIVARFLLGIPATVISEVTEWHDSGDTRRAVFATATGPLRARGIHTFLTTSIGTHYTWSMEWDERPGPLGATLNLLMRRAWSGKLQPPLDNLKRLLETQEQDGYRLPPPSSGPPA